MNDFNLLEQSEPTPQELEWQAMAETFSKEIKYFEVHAIAVGSKQAAETMVEKLGLDKRYTLPIQEYLTATNKALDIHMIITNTLSINQPEAAMITVRDTYNAEVPSAAKWSKNPDINPNVGETGSSN